MASYQCVLWGLFFCFSYLLSLIFWYLGNGGFIISGLLPSFSFFSFLQDLKFDMVSEVCLLMLGACGFIALVYCYHYFQSGKEGLLLWLVMLLFIFVMGGLMMSGSLMVTLVGWEYLGLVSFFLILFYGNSASIRAALITLFASRFGDVALFALFGFILHSYYNWSLGVVGVLFLLVILTKSASFPFISWLLEAMRAPTPVSSLVHSSTLVAAGVWFLLRYSNSFNESFSSFCFSLCLLSVFITGISACVYTDMKKIVALSTCNNICWCLIYFLNGCVGLALIQLISHGVCKCYLFMGVGDLMSSSGSSQQSGGIYHSNVSSIWGGLFCSFLIFSLCGLPFMGIFYSKHVLISSFVSGFNVWSFTLSLIGFFLSYVYSIRFSLLFLRNKVGISSGILSSFWIVGLIGVGSSLYNYWEVESVCESGVVGSGVSILFIVIISSGLILGVLGYLAEEQGLLSMNVSLISSLVGGCEILVNGFYNIVSGLLCSSVLCYYRWEVSLVRSLNSFFGYKLGSFFVKESPLNYAVLGLVISLFMVLIFS